MTENQSPRFSAFSDDSFGFSDVNFFTNFQRVTPLNREISLLLFFFFSKKWIEI